MIINSPKKIIFIHINKTGGTSITKLFRNYINKKNIVFQGIRENRGLGETEDFNLKNKHFTLKKYKNNLKNFHDYFIFTIVRNPYSRALSLYYWHKNNKKAIGIKCTDPNYFDPEDFKLFVLRLKTPKKEDCHGRFLEHDIYQYKSLILDNNTIYDKIKFLKFENLNEIYKLVELKELIKNEKLEHCNKSGLSTFNYIDIYIKYPEIQEFVYNFWKDDFIKLKYEKKLKKK
jgi:hypothetical protein